MLERGGGACQSQFKPCVRRRWFVRSAGGQPAKFAVYAVAGLALVIYLLSLAGEAGATSGNAIDYENNAITIALERSHRSWMPIGPLTRRAMWFWPMSC